MKNNYFAIQIEKDGKYHAYTLNVDSGQNLVSALNIPNIYTANIFPTKKRVRQSCESLE